MTSFVHEIPHAPQSTPEVLVGRAYARAGSTPCYAASPVDAGGKHPSHAE
jgi:hypothetical protein